MLNKVKNQVEEMLGTLKEALDYLYSFSVKNDQDNIMAVIGEFLNSLEKVCKDESPRFLEFSMRFRENIYNYQEEGVQSKLYLYYKEMVKCVSEIPRQYKVLFLPYYENTWDSLKSVYDAFNKDPEFITEIVIIPIYRNVPTGTIFVYDDYLTPQGIKNTHYSEYSLEIDQPDIVFYNNPYDGVNLRKFASHNVRKHAGCMVYIPYFLETPRYLTNEYLKFTVENTTGLPGHDNADIMIAGSDWVVNEIKGENSFKRIALGNPKTDYFVEAQRKGKKKVPEWGNKKLSGYTFMLNTHYSDAVVENPLYIHIIETIINFIGQNKECSLIWRPHPQTFLMLQGRQDEFAKKFYSLMAKADKANRIVLDRSGSTINAYMNSDAYISTSWSSTTLEALFFDMPTFLCKQCITTTSDINIINKDKKVKKDNLYWQDVVICPEFEAKKDDDWNQIIIEFMVTVMSGDDYNREKRQKFIKQAFKNGDGSCGDKICQYVKGKLQMKKWDYR